VCLFSLCEQNLSNTSLVSAINFVFLMPYFVMNLYFIRDTKFYHLTDGLLNSNIRLVTAKTCT